MKRTQMRDVAYRILKDQILNNELKPNESIVEMEFAERNKMSRTPVREAIVRLESEGLVQIFPNKGPIVRSLSLDDIIKVSQTREALEGMAARIACNQIDFDCVQQLKEKMLSTEGSDGTLEQELSLQYGRELHNAILQSTENDIIIKTVENMKGMLNQIMALSRQANKRVEVNFEQHMRIISALLSRNPELAEKHMRNHIISVTNDVISIYQRKHL